VNRVLLYVPSYRDIPVARDSWLVQKADDSWVDVFIMKYNPHEPPQPYLNQNLKAEIARKMFIAGDYDYMFHVEDDIILPSHALQKLLSAKKEIISGIFCLRPEVSGTNAFAARIIDIEGPQASDDRYLTKKDIKDPGEIIQCTLTGLGCLLIARRLLHEIKDVWGIDWKLDKELMTKHIPLYVHTGVWCGHIDSTGKIWRPEDNELVTPYRSYDLSPGK